jgi:altronate dehydratase
MYVNSIFAGFAAAGAQLTLLQYGGGGNPGRTIFDPPSPGVVAPLRASANLTQAQGTGNLDFYSGSVIKGKETMEDAGERLVKWVLEVASGTLTHGETINYSNPTEIYTIDPVF